MKGLIKCAACGTEMVREYEGDKIKLRASILVWEKNKCIGKCRKCGADVPLQLSLTMPKKNSIKLIVSR